MTTDVSPTPQKIDSPSVGTGSLGIGILLVVLGVIAIALPGLSTIFAETWIALFLITAGGAKIAYGFQNRASQGFIWQILLGALYIGTGVMLLVTPRTGILSLTLLLGTFLLTEGVFELIMAFKVRPQKNWLYLLGNSIVTLVLGGMIWAQWPLNAPWVIGTLVGVSILCTGISRVMLSLGGRSTLNPSNLEA
ncbi:DUF308 domain-containing protein [Phormidium sp. CLA17]|uniref:HdeD family acid-resistance protein n=1 Tax=Leptolyngbya sp. Cla-17 TaxID=2803751 RepID=UPI001490D8B8|nr:DUF308 domain-containing protein [Leptolyngbya sp. Cla-17]MBM0742359.1 DUF308 domain-containing protein [Leptolyngbya sp. Cla-17]